MGPMMTTRYRRATPFAVVAARLVACSALALSLSACTVSSSHSQYFGKVDPPSGQTLRYVSGPEPESLDPQLTTGQPEGRILMALFDGLTEYDPKTAEPIPALAERWDANADNSVFIFHLRPARWSNGRPLTAHDFVYSIRRGLSPALAARAAYLAYYIQYAEAYNESGVFAQDPRSGAFVMDPAHPDLRLVLPGDEASRAKALADPDLAAAVRGKTFVPVRAEDVGVDALDDETLRIRLTQPVPFLVALMAHHFFRPVPREAIEQWGDQWTSPGHMVTSGAFVLRDWRPYDRIVVTRNPMYWDAASVHLDSITFFPIEDATTIMNLYKAGDVDAVLNRTVPAAWVDELRQYKDYMDGPEAGNEYYQINTTRPPMNDARVRHALNMAIDKPALAGYLRMATAETSFVPAGIFPDYPVVAGDSFDPAKARALLAEAGYRRADGTYDPLRFPVDRVEVSYNTLELHRHVAEFVQAQWKQNLGLTIPLKNVEWKTFLDSRARLDYNGIARSGWIGDYMDPYTFLSIFATPTGDNGTGWWDPSYVALLNRANRQHDPAARDALLAEAEAKLLDAQPVIPLFTTGTDWVKKPYVKGMYANPVSMFAWKYVWIEHDPSRW
jgi:ABC-type oligopeptide transport system substrate-binding subunit